MPVQNPIEKLFSEKMSLFSSYVLHFSNRNLHTLCCEANIIKIIFTLLFLLKIGHVTVHIPL